MRIEVIKSKRKSMVLTIKNDGTIIVKAPNHVNKDEINAFVLKHEDWIINRKNEVSKKVALSDDEKKRLANLAKTHILSRVLYFKNLMGVEPSQIKITSANKRWGSCSYKNSLCFSYRIMLLPEHLIDYIVVHELSHIKEKNHSKNFYKVVETYLKNYKELEKEIKYLEKTLPF